MLETDPIVDAVCAKFQSRSAMGIKKYGTTLADNPSTVKEKLVHIQEELMDGANYIEWLLQDYSSYGVSPAMEAVKMMEKEMPTPMTIEMEANETADLDFIKIQMASLFGYAASRNIIYEIIDELYDMGHIQLKQLTKTTENVTCENLSNANERQAALASLKREYELNGSNPYNWFIRDYYDVLRAALQSPRVPVVGVLKDCLKRIEEIRLVDLGAVRDAEMQDYQERKIIARRELAKTNELINQINTAITSATLSSARVHVIEGLDEAISAYDYPHTTGGIGSDDLEKVVKAARAYAELQKGV